MLKLKQHTVFAIVNIANTYQDAKFEATVSRNSLYYIIYIKVTMAQARIFIHFCAVVLLFFVKTVIA